jgi:hypothetical protein
MSTARTAPAGTKANPIVLDAEPEIEPPAKRGRFDVRDGTGGTVRVPVLDPTGDPTGDRNPFRTPGGLESVAESEAEEGSPSPDPTTEPEHSQSSVSSGSSVSSVSSVSSGPVDEPETLPEYERGVSDESETETVCYQCGEPEGEGTTFQIERASGICDDCLQEEDGDDRK